mmetsp:Transcript_11938/g.39660  ORF Transcript_11938/g.39660 Transcript_11938/m.39660 type:complete len:220 (-) Transcript_11938:177-836(-)
MQRRPVSAFARATAAVHARTRWSYGAHGWSARPWSSLMMSMPPFANWYAIFAKSATDDPIGFSAVMIIGPNGTFTSFRNPSTPNLGPGYSLNTQSGIFKSATITPSFIEVFPKTTFMSCVISPPVVSVWYEISHRQLPFSPAPGVNFSSRPTTCSRIHMPSGTRASGSSTVCSKQIARILARASFSLSATTSYTTVNRPLLASMGWCDIDVVAFAAPKD